MPLSTLLNRLVAWELLTAASAYGLMTMLTGLSPKKNPQVGFFALGFCFMMLAMLAKFLALLMPPPLGWKIDIPSSALIFMSAAAFSSGFVKPSSRPIAEIGVVAAGTVLLAVGGDNPLGSKVIETCYGFLFLLMALLTTKVYHRTRHQTLKILAIALLLVGVSGLISACTLIVSWALVRVLVPTLHVLGALSFVWALAEA